MSLPIFYLVGIVFVIGGSALVYICCLRARLVVIAPRVLYLLGALFVYVPLAQELKYRSLHVYVDFSHWEQLLYSIATRGIPATPNVGFLIAGSANYFAVHFVPFVYLLALPFRLFPYAETMILLNALLMASSCIPLYKLTLKVSASRPLALLASVMILWYPTFQYATLYEFEMLRFSIPLLLWMLYFFESGETALFLLFAFLASLLREDVGVTVFAFGLSLMLTKGQRRLGAVTAVLGMGMFLTITGLVMPIFSTSASYEHVAVAQGFRQWGSTPLAMVAGMLRRPAAVLAAAAAPGKIANIFMLLLPLLFVPLFSLSSLIGASGSLGIGLVSSWPLYVSYLLYYVAPAIPFLFYGFVKAWPRFLAWLERATPRTMRPERSSVGAPAMSMALSAVLFANVWFGPSPISLQFWFRNFRPAPFQTENFHVSVYRVTEHHRRAEAFIAMIPDNAIVSAPEFLHPRLFRKKGAMIYPRLDSADGATHATYVLLDRTNNGHAPESQVFVTQAQFAIIAGHPELWERIAADDGYELYRIRSARL